MTTMMTRAERRILAALADGEWHAERELRSSFAFLQSLCLRGILDGAMAPGMYERLWRLKCTANAR
jgi:hypothetical protein